MKKSISLLLLFSVISICGAFAQSGSKINLSGHIASAYDYNDESDVSTFAIKRAWLESAGAINPLVEYRLLLDFAVQNSIGKPEILDSWVRFNFNDAFKVQLGQFKLPVTMQNTISPLKMATISSSQIVKNFLGARTRDVGISLQGGLWKRDGFNTLEYNIGLYNGNGWNTVDNDKKKDFAGRITANITKEISLTGSFYKGTILLNDKYVDNNRLGAGIQYQNSKATLRAEYMEGDLKGINSYGCYALASYSVNSKLRPVISYDYFRTDSDRSDSGASNYVAGFNYYPLDCIILQANYTLRKYADSARDNANMLCVQCVVKF